MGELCAPANEKINTSKLLWIQYCHLSALLIYFTNYLTVTPNQHAFSGMNSY